MRKKAKRKGQGRGTFAIVLITIIALVISGKLFQIQIVQASELNEVSKDKRSVPVIIPSPRGDVIDRNGVVLASTEERYDVQLSPKNTLVHDGTFYRLDPEDRTKTVEVTSEQAFAEIGLITGQTGAEIQAIVDEELERNPESDFAYVKRSVSLEQLNQLKELWVPWLSFDYNFQRKYPNGAVAGNLIGFAGYDAEPLAGVELSQDQCLQGQDGYETYERGADGVALPGSHVTREQAINGGTVQLTIDSDLQWQAQQIVNTKTSELGAEWVMAVVQDIKTGELLAIAEDNSVDPGNVEGTVAEKREARSFVAPYEPGSTFKILTAASLLDSGKATPTSQYATPWTYEPEPGVRFSDWFEHGIENWTLAGIMAFSSNVGTAMLGTQLSAKERYKYIRAFGFGESTNAGMPLEDAGLLYQYEDWDAQTNYNITFGQGLSSTIIQTASLYQTIANGGVRIPPKLVSGCIDAEGNITEYEHGEESRVISKKAAKQTLEILETVVEDSWVKDSLTIPGYRIGGKTGTGEQPDGRGGYREQFVHSFAGVFPLDDPQYVIVASIGFPDVYITGTSQAVNIVKELSEITIRTNKVKPSKGKPETHPIYYSN